MNDAEIVEIQTSAALSRAEWREFRALATIQGEPVYKYLGWVIRNHLAAEGRPTEGSVKA